MKGLSMFITDLTRCNGKHEERIRIGKELVNIRNNFKSDKPLNSYQKRKYVCKLVFISLSGYKCDFGIEEAVKLLSSNTYGGKQAGYLFLSVVKGVDCNLMPFVNNVLETDLSSNQDVFQNMALQFIANSPSLNLADLVINQVLEILISEHTIHYIKQGAILALLQIFRTKSDLRLPEPKMNYLTNLISHSNLGLATASASLIEFIAKNVSFKDESCMEQCILRLNVIISSCIDFRDYKYYSISAPWMCVKLLRILLNFSTPSDISLKFTLKSALEMIFQKANDGPQNVNKFEHDNLKYAIIFDAISLVIHMNLKGYIFSRALNILRTTLESEDVNFRFMALEAMTQISNSRMYLEDIKPQWNVILKFLKSESDIAMKKQAVELLYTIRSNYSARPTVDELLNLLEYQDDFYEKEVVLQAINLVEQFRIDDKWYFDTMLNLFHICRDKVSENMTHSLVNIVQKYAAKASYTALCETNCCDAIIKLAGYILGEFGYLIVDDLRTSCRLQFNALKGKYNKSSPSTKAVLLTTFMKFYNVCPDIKDEVQCILKDELSVQNETEEIQQRAVEYFKMIEIASRDLLAVVFGPMPSKMQKVPTTIECSNWKD